MLSNYNFYFYTNLITLLTHLFIFAFDYPHHVITKHRSSEPNNLADKGDTGIETTTANVQLETTTNVEFENIENLVETFNIDIRKR